MAIINHTLLKSVLNNLKRNSMKEKELEFTIRILKDIIENNGGTYLVNRYRELQQQLKDLKDKNKEILEETLEEVMNENGYHDQTNDTLWREGVLFGAKWQQERSYSEEEVIDIFFLGRESLNKSLITKEEALEVIKQYKKK